MKMVLDDLQAVQYLEHFVEDEEKSLELNAKNIKNQDAIVITTDHSNVDYELIGKHAKLIIDTRNVMTNIKNPNARILRA